MSKSDTSQPQFEDYQTSHGLRWALILLVIAALVWALFNYKDLLVRDPKSDTKGWLAFVSDRNGHEDIWTVDAAGKLNALTDDEFEDLSPTWQPDGNRIAFTSTRTNEKTKKVAFQLFSILPNGNGLQGLTVGGGAKEDPHYSHDGKRILHIAQGFVTEVETKEHHADQLVPSAENEQSVLAWRALFSGNETGDVSVGFRKAMWAPINEDLILAQLAPDKGNMLFFATTTPADGVPLPLIAAKDLTWAWSPNSSDFIICFHERIPLSEYMPGSKDVPFPKNGILVLNIATAEQAKGAKNVIGSFGAYVVLIKTAIPTDNKLEFLEPSYSPDGSKIIFALGVPKADGVDRKSIVVLPASSFDTGQQTFPQPSQIVFGAVGNPMWSPDGSKIVYLIYGKSGRDLWVVNDDGTLPHSVTEGKGDNRDMVWSPQK